MSEQWREISGRDGDYEVSNQGRVKSHKRKKPCILRHDMDRFGYHRVVLYENGERRKYQVHRLVAEAFIGPAPSNKHEINHADGCKDHNSADNLEWTTSSENKLHAERMGLVDRVRGERHGQSKLITDDVKKIRQLCANGKMLQREIAAMSLYYVYCKS